MASGPLYAPCWVHHHFRQVLDRCFVMHVRYLTTDCQASPQASVKQYKASVKRHKASVKHVPSICQVSTYDASVKQQPSICQASTKQPPSICTCLTHAWGLLGTCLTDAWWLLDRCLIGTCLTDAWYMLDRCFVLLDRCLMGCLQAAQSICQALDGNGGVRVVILVFPEDWMAGSLHPLNLEQNPLFHKLIR